MSAVPESSSEANPEHLLVLDDEKSIRWVLERTLTQSGYHVPLATDASEAHHLLNQYPIRLALVDINLPDQDGISFTQNVSTQFPKLMTIVMTGQGTMHNTIEAMKAGAFEFVTKPFDILQIEELGRQALKVRHAEKRDSSDLKSSSEELLVGQGPKMRELFKSIGRVASTELTVLIQGESGTGKELISTTIHQHSNRAKGPFVAINCAAIPSELLESELFGHEKGAFTGAVERKRGKLEQAGNGTLFLDEIGDMPLKLQSKLLRVLQERQFERIGGQELLTTNMRVIAATHRDLEQLMQQEQFRTDLYYRLNVFPLSIPPLRERVEDLPLLVEHFLKRGAREMAVGNKSLSPEAMDALKRYPWPGNVRELENTLKSLMITNVSNFISLDSFPGHLMKKGKPVQESGNLEEWIEDKIAPLVREGITKNTDSLMQEVLHKVERPLLKLLLEETGWNQQKTSKLLGINRNTLRKKIETLRIRRKVVLDA